MNPRTRETAGGASPHAAAPTEASSPPMDWLARFEVRLAPWGERLNPILVKEARQALKSRRFISTFGLVLVFACGWSFLGVAWMGDSIHTGSAGPTMFFGYYCVLAFPLLVVVPYGAFQSLAGERHDGTHELLSITTLKPRQLVTGKLASVLLEMLVYLSAVAPCLGFTYLLRGIDLPTILWVLFYTCQGSLGLSLIGLLLGTITSERHWQMVLNVLLVMGLLAVFFASLVFMGGLLSQEIEVAGSAFLVTNLALLSVIWSVFGLAFAATTAQLTFAADNRSTLLRVVMFINHVTLLGWMGYAWKLAAPPVFVPPEVLVTLLIVGYMYWAAMGVFLVAERPEMSHRVRRSLPQTLFARALFTWFTPGPGTGYMFVLANVLVLGLAMLGGCIAMQHRIVSPSWSSWKKTIENVVFVGFLYITIYLGAGRLLIDIARRRFAVSLPLGLLIQAVVITLACVIPLIPYLLFAQQPNRYSISQLANPFWTIKAVINDDLTIVEEVDLYCTLIVAAVLVFLLNMPRVFYEVSRVRVAKPRRVIEEETAESPQPAVQTEPSSPWDQPQPSEQSAQ